MSTGTKAATTKRGPVDVGAIGDFADGEVSRVEVRGRGVGVLRRAERVHAFADRCPHMGAPMCPGRLVSRIETGPDGELEVCEGAVLACPWHGWEFEVAGGRSLTDPRYRVRTYAAWVEDGRVLVDPARHAEEARS